MNQLLCSLIVVLASMHVAVASDVPGRPTWEAANPIQPLPTPPLGITRKFSDLKEPPTPETVRLGRWLYYDKRLSADGTISCASCHRPENAFSEPTPVSTGIRGQKGTRKAPAGVNAAWTIYPHFFWDGRAASLEEQALGPVANPVEMGNTHEAMVATIDRIPGYKPYFAQAFGTSEITRERIAKALADYERTRLSGNSAYDQWQERRFDDGFRPTERQKDIAKGFELFFGKARCNQCHLSQNFTDSLFHNLGIGWDPARQEFTDIGRFKVSNREIDKGAFKTPTLRDVTRHAPYMHDGSLSTLRDVVEHYNKGGNANPYLDNKIKPLNLTKDEVDLLVYFMQSLDGEGYMDKAPAAFPE